MQSFMVVSAITDGITRVDVQTNEVTVVCDIGQS